MLFRRNDENELRKLFFHGKSNVSFLLFIFIFMEKMLHEIKLIILSFEIHLTWLLFKIQKFYDLIYRIPQLVIKNV